MVATRPANEPRLLVEVRSILPQLRAAVEITEAERRLPDAVIAALRAAGVYRMFVPKALGGDEVDLQTFVDTVDLVSQGNSAAGWNLAATSVLSLFTMRLPRAGVEQIYRDGPDVIGAGSFGSGGARAVAAAGGYRVTGRWGFGSGCMHADWMGGGACRVYDGETPRVDAGGQPVFIACFFPRAEVTVHDTWRVVGMRGTGSHDWSVTDHFVPEYLTGLTTAASSWPGVLYEIPVRIFTTVHFSAVATGIARRAIDSLVELAKGKSPIFEKRFAANTGGLLCERVQVQEAVARAEVLLESARAYRASVIADLWAAAEAGEPVSVEQATRMRLAGTNASESAVRAVDMMFTAGGTTSIEEANPLAGCFRDVHVVAQSIVVQPIWYEHAGRVLLGMEPGALFM